MRRRIGSAPIITLLAITLIFFLGACSRATPTPTATPVPSTTPTPTPVFTRTPTIPPPASEENPLILGVLSETNDPKAATAASEIARQIARITNYRVNSRVYTTSQGLLSDLQTNKVHIVFLQPFTYLWAQQKGWVRPLLLTNHFGVYQYGASFFANVASKFTLYFDPSKGLNTVNPAVALKQFEGKRPCWVDPTSASGYVVPAGLLAENKVSVQEGVITQSHSGVIRSLYITGLCDFGAAFATTGDPRTASVISQDLTDVMNRVVIIYQIDPIIPNLNISVLASLPREMREDLSFALQSTVRLANGKALFTDATGYEINELKPLDDALYDPLRNLQKLSGGNLETLIGK